MILSSALAVRAGEVDPLLGNAKVYDGTFDSDVVGNFDLTSFNSPLTVTFLCTFKRTDRSTVFETRTTQDFLGFFFGASSLQINCYTNAGSLLRVRSTISDGGTAKRIVAVRFTVGSNASGVDIFFNGAKLSTTVISNATINNFTQSAQDLYLGSVPPSSPNNFFIGFIKQMEFLSNATDQECIDATTGGSFRSAGIAHSSGRYLLAVDFDKTNGNPPTTFAGTPSYTITSFGGAEYVDYSSL